MELKKSTKKFVAYICAIAMVIVSMAGYQTPVNAATFSVTDEAGATYTISNERGNYVGFVLQGAFDNVRFGFAWSGDATAASAKATVQIQKEGTTVLDLGTQGNGMSIWVKDLASLSDGTYSIVFTGQGDFTNQVETVELTVSGKGEVVAPDPTEAPSGLQWTELFDSFGKATVTNTSTEEVYGATFTGFTTDWSWGPDSKWHGQAKKADIPVVNGQKYNVSFNIKTTPAKKVLVQTLTGADYTEKTFDANGDITMSFTATAATAQIVIAFGAIEESEVGTYDVEISNLKIEETGKTPEEESKDAEIARVKEILTGDTNIAKNKPVFASSEGTPAKEAFDGNLGSRWAAGSINDNEYVGVNLEALYSVSSVALMWEGAYASEYEVQVSTDGENYTTVASKTGVTTNETLEIVLDEPADAQFVRILCVKAGTQWNTSIWECGVYGTKKGEGTTTEAPTTEPVTEDPVIAGLPETVNVTIGGDAQGNPIVAGVKTFYAVYDCENAASYSVYLGQVVEGNLAATANAGWVFEKKPQKWADNIAQTKDGSIVCDFGNSYKVIVIAYNEAGEAIGKGTATAVIPEKVELDGTVTFKEAKVTVNDEGAVMLNASWEGKAGVKYTTFINKAEEGYEAVAANGHRFINVAQASVDTVVKTYNEEITITKDETYTIIVCAYDNDGVKIGENSISIVASEGETGEIPTTEPVVEKEPIEVVGHTIQEQNGASVTFTWGQNDEQMALGQAYNVYIDGTLYKESVAPQSITYEFATAGAHVIKITAVLGDKETEGVTLDVTVEGDEPESSTPTEPVEMTFEEIAGTGVDITRGNFTLWINTTNKMAIAVDPTDADHIQGKIISNNNNWDQWGAVQYKIIKTGLKPGEEYTISVDMKASGDDGVIVSNGDVTADLKQGTEVTFTRTVAADENGQIDLSIGAGQVGIGVVLDFSNVVVKDSQGNIVGSDVPEPSTTPADEPESTTPADEPESTTPADNPEPSTQEPATSVVAPETTTAKAAVKAPKKTKVKKASKKKSSKKAKISLKKVKGAKGYYVQISKTKKFKKVLVKKHVKKATFTIKNKKLKNKKKLYVRAKAYVLDGKQKVYSKKWSKVKRMKIKK